MATADDDKNAGNENHWNCAMCLEHLKCPKLLPCSHTFCEACLGDLVKHHPSGYFPCPSCREKVRVPQGGVSAFKNNFYLESLKENKMPMCKQKHEKSREIELYCSQCDACICLECKISDHLHHNTEDVRMTAKMIKAKLDRDQMGLSGEISDFKKHLEKFQKEQQAVGEKRAAVEKDIKRRRQMMVDEADRCQAEALFSLDTVTASINSQLDGIIKEMEKNLEELIKLHKRMKMCVKDEDGGGLLMTAQDIYVDALKQEKVVRGLMGQRIENVSRPVLHFSASAELTFKTQQKFMGQVEKMDAQLKEPQFTVKEVFQCPQENDTVSVEISSLCPRINDTVWIAYDHEYNPEDDGITSRHPELYDIKGQVIDTDKSSHGRITFTHTKEGESLRTSHTQRHFSTYAKSGRLYKLTNDQNGKASVISVLTNSGKPLKILEDEVCQIKCGQHRAFDVDENVIVYAVLEEGLDAAGGRKVHLYHHKYEFPLATYQPPAVPFHPSDVCFYKLAGRHVLLVTDDVNDAIHVVGVEKGDLRFLGYLAAGSPLLIQPTALNTDVNNRLWVACRNGSVLLCEPVTQCD